MTISKNTTRIRRPKGCPICKSTNLVMRPDEECSVCLDCGFVVSAETAAFSHERKTNAEQNKTTRHTLRSSKTSLNDKEPNCENIASTLEQWKQVKIGDAAEKNLAIALQYITKTAIDLSLSKAVLEKASIVYKKIIEKKLVKGRSIRTLAATAVYIGCKQCGIAVTTKGIAHVSKISPREITRSYRLVTKQINFAMQPASVSKYAAELSKKLQIPERTILVMEKIAETMQHSKSLAGKDQTGIACAAIYIGSVLTGEKRTRREIAEAARITEQTIRVRCRELEKELIFNITM